MKPIEYLGLVATLFIFFSFFFNDKKWIRLGNTAGSILFVIYGLHIGALSVWLLNGACAVLNIIKVIKENKNNVAKHLDES